MSGPAGTSGRDGKLAAASEQARPRLIRMAYAVLGSYAEAEDVMSECLTPRSS